jgi:hypothetical protein
MLRTCEDVVTDWQCQTEGCLMNTTAMLLCNAMTQTCYARLWGCSQNVTILKTTPSVDALSVAT